MSHALRKTLPLIPSTGGEGVGTVTHNSEETQKFAEDFVQQLQPGDIICLYGDLGAGKTTFVQGLAKGLKIKKRIISPTFVIIRLYELRPSPSPQFSPLAGEEVRYFYHVDLYRLRGEQDIEGTGLLEILNKKDSIVAIEWSEKMGSLLPEKKWEVRLEYVEGDRRKIRIEKNLSS